MNTRTVVSWSSAVAVCAATSALFVAVSVGHAQPASETDVVAAISNLESDAVKADLAGDASFYRRLLAENWTRGDSDGTFYTKAEVVGLMADPTKFKTNSEQISDLKVRAYANAAVATYKDTYDILILGHRRAHSIIATDTFVRTNGGWKQVASHGAETK